MRLDIVASRHLDQDVRTTIREVYERRGCLLDPHSAIGYLGARDYARRTGQVGIFLATAHPAKFPEVVEPIIGHAIPKPAALADALARPHRIIRSDATVEALRSIVGA